MEAVLVTHASGIHRRRCGVLTWAGEESKSSRALQNGAGTPACRGSNTRQKRRRPNRCALLPRILGGGCGRLSHHRMRSCAKFMRGSCPKWVACTRLQMALAFRILASRMFGSAMTRPRVRYGFPNRRCQAA